MARKTKTTELAPSANSYEAYRETRIWKIVAKAVDDLVENNDLIEKTRRDYIVGYICKELQEAEKRSADHNNGPQHHLKETR